MATTNDGQPPPKAAKTAAEEEEEEAKTAKFVLWCEARGIAFSSKVAITTKNVVHGRGMVAVDEIEAGHVLFEIPRTALLSRKTACISKELKEAFGEEISDPHAAFSSLVLAISSEASRGEASGFLPYLELLPPLDTLEHPHFWSEDALKLLEGSNAYEIVERDLQAMSQQYDTSFNPFLAKNPDATLDAFRRFSSIVMAYSFTDDQTEEVCMVPVADILNHVTGKNNARLFYNDDNLQMCSLVPIQAGQEIFNTYGSLDNCQLLTKHGFIEENTEFDEVEVPVVNMWPAADSLSLRNQKREFLQSHFFLSEEESPKFSIQELNKLNDVQRNALRALSIMFCRSDQLEKLDSANYTAEGYDSDDEDEEPAVVQIEPDMSLASIVSCQDDPVIKNISKDAFGPFLAVLETLKIQFEPLLTRIVGETKHHHIAKQLHKNSISILDSWIHRNKTS